MHGQVCGGVVNVFMYLAKNFVSDPPWQSVPSIRVPFNLAKGMAIFSLKIHWRDDSRNLCDTDCMTAHTQHLQQKDFAQELPKMDFQDHFVDLNVGNIKSPKVFTKKIKEFKVMGKEESC